jgi:sugar lactone lactonase YvrE
MHRMTVISLLACLACLASAPPAFAAALHGRVASGDTGLGGYGVTLYATDPARPKRCAQALASSATAADGAFDLAYTPPASAEAVLYLIAESGAAKKAGKCPTTRDGAVVLAAVVGVGGAPAAAVVNERTTVASAYAYAQFFDGADLRGPSPGLQNAFAMLQNTVDVETGALGAVIATPPNGAETSALPTFNALANVVAACIASPDACAALFAATDPPRGPRPRDTLAALVDLARAPGQDQYAVLGVSLAPPAPYQPALAAGATLDAWTLALRFVGDGQSMDGPGNFAIDAQGTIWVGNNYAYSADPFAPVCASTQLIRFTPGGQYVPGSPYADNGLAGVGFGITLDPDGNVWVGNFGFASTSCTTPPPSNTVSKFGPNGEPLSSGGFSDGMVSWPQGTVSDQDGTIWIANCGNGTVTRYPNGDNGSAEWSEGSVTGLDRPFGIAIDRKGFAWVTGSNSNNVAVLRPDGTPIARSPIDDGLFDRPLGIAADSRGNMWVANSAALKIPCPDGALEPTGGSVVLVRHNARPARRVPFTGGGLTIPWGIAVDGSDNVWVANFKDQRVSYFCGTRTSNCPPGTKTGDPLAPNGFGFDGLTRNTGLAIDPSGNLWVANNWKADGPVLPNPGGYQVVAFVGVATPIRTPLIGPPSRP